MLITDSYNTNFINSVKTVSANKLKPLLLSGRQVRMESAKNSYFWDIAQNTLHRDFDLAYGAGIQRLAEIKPSRFSIQSPSISRMLGKASVIGGSGFGGWLIGKVYTQSFSNLILHEYGHAWAANAVYQHPHTTVVANAWHWLKKGEWSKWFLGVRKGGPGNYTWIVPGRLSDFGLSLSRLERDLCILSGGLGVELIANTMIAGLGLVAMRKKQRALGASMLGFAVISHSAAHSYIRRYSELLTVAGWQRRGIRAGDPPSLAQMLAEYLHISNLEAFTFLWYGYLLFPIFLLAMLFVMLTNPAEIIPDECILMRLVAEDESLELKKIMTECELEFNDQWQHFATLPKDQQEALLVEMTDRLLSKVKNNPMVHTEFKKTQAKVAKEQGITSNWVYKLQGIAAITAFAAYTLRTLKVASVFSKAVYYLTGTFLIAQGVSTVLEELESARELSTRKVSNLGRWIIITRMVISAATLIILTPAMLIPYLAGLSVPFFIAATVARLALLGLQVYDRKEENLANKALN